MPAAKQEVDLAAVRSNLRLVRARSDRPVIAVVKADAYGHGAVEVARALAGELGLLGLAVAHVDEGLALRAAGVRGTILVLAPALAGLSERESAEVMVEIARSRLTPAITSLDELDRWRSGDIDEPVSVHLKIDTGMGRSGLSPSQVPAALERLATAEELVLEGIYTHLAASEELENAFTEQQMGRFAEVCPQQPGLLRHAANSAAALHRPMTRLDAVRVGGAVYGVDLAERENSDLTPAMRVLSSVAHVKRISSGESVGYNRRFRARRETTVALVPIGYGDGVDAGASDVEVLLRGRRTPVIGTVSMDLITVDVTDVGATVGDEVVVLGGQGKERISVFDHARWSGGPAYEVLCRFSRRLPREFVS